MTDTTSLRREKLAFSIAEVMEVHIAIGPTTTADKAVEIFELLGPIFADLARVTAERDAELAVADELAGALIWCSGSEDFNEGGLAVVGWRKLARPAIEAYLSRRPSHSKGCTHTDPCECGETE